MRLHCLHRLLLCGILAGAWPLAAQAQAQATAPGNGTDASDARTAQDAAIAPRAIPLQDLQARADADEGFANTIIGQAAGTDPLAGLVPRLAAIEASVDGKRRQLDHDALRALPILRLESLDRHWGFDATRFARWRGDFHLRAAPFTADAADATHRLAEWRATRAALPADALPAALSGRIDDLVTVLTRAGQALSAPLDAQIALGRRANRLEARIEAGRQAVDSAIEDIDRRLLRMDAPPL